MEESYEEGNHAAWRAIFRRKYLSHLMAVLRHGRTQTVTRASARIRAVRLATDMSLAMRSRCRSAWSRAILAKYLFKLNKSRLQLRVLKSRRNLRGVRTSVSAGTRRFKTTALRNNFTRGLLRTASRTRHNSKEEAGGTVAARMQTLRLLIPGSCGLDTPVFLEEAGDYISALEKQVQAMQALAYYYSN